METTLTWDGVVPLAQVLEHVRPAYGGDTWDEAFAYLTSTPSEAKVIEELAASGPTGFTEPIRVWFDEEDLVWRIGNGMHRVATAYRLGHKHISCCLAYPPTDPDTEYVEVHYRLPGDWPEDDIENDAMAFACGWLRSFPLPDGTWVETDLLASHSGVLNGMWTCPHSHAEILVSEMARRSPAFELVSMRCLTEAQWSAELAAEGY